MDYSALRIQLNELKNYGNGLLSRLTDIAAEEMNDFETAERWDQFLASMEKSISQLESKASKYAEIRSVLEKFTRIVPPNNYAPAEFDTHKTTVLKYLEMPADNNVDKFARPYALFAAIAEQPDMDLSPEDGDFIDEFFGRGITRPLYQGKYTFADGHDDSEDSDCDEREVSDNDETTLPEADVPAELPYVVKTQKENANFSAKSFVSNFAEYGELKLLHLLASMGAITYRQLKASAPDRNISESHINKMINNGYISIIEYKNSGAKFFALSAKGAKVFKKDTSRDIMKKIGNIPQKIWDCGERCLSYIDACTGAYERAAWVAIQFTHPTWLKKNFPDHSLYESSIERIAVDEQRSVIFIKVFSETLAYAALELLLYSDAGKVTIFLIDGNARPPFADNASLFQPEKFPASFIEHPGIKSYYCTFSGDNHADTFDSEGNATNLEDIVADALNKRPKRQAAPFTRDSEPPEHTAEIASVMPELSQMPEPESSPSDNETVNTGGYGGSDNNFIINPDDEPSSIAQKILASDSFPKDRGGVDALISALMSWAVNVEDGGKTDYLGRALVLLKSLAVTDTVNYEPDYQRLLLATDFPLDTRIYTGERLLTLFDEKNEGTAIHLAALLRALFAPYSEHDYTLPQYADGLFARYDEVFGKFSALKSTLNDFMKIRDVSREGFSERVTNYFLDAQTKSDIYKQLSKDAKDLKSSPNIRQYLKGMPEMLLKCFGPDSLLGMCMGIIAESRSENRSDVYDVYSDFTEDGKISPEKIKLAFDEAWKKIQNRKVQDVIGIARDKILEAFRERLDLIERWLACTDDNLSAENPNLQSLHGKIRSALRSACDLLSEDTGLLNADRAVLIRALSNMLQTLDGAKIRNFKMEDWLSGYFLSMKANVPVIDEKFTGVMYCEPWRNALRHIAGEPQDLHDVLARIENEDDPLYDNLGQAIMICEYFNDTNKKELYHKSVENARKASDANEKQFCDRLVIDLAYGRVSGETVEKIRGTLEGLKSVFLESNDFARFRDFLTALSRPLDDEIEKNRARWADAIKKRREKSNNEFLDRAERFLENENVNFILVEEALNNFDSNADPDQGELIHNEEALFDEFISDANFNGLFDLCRKHKMMQLRKFAPDFVKNRIERLKLSKRYIESAQKLVQSLPNTPVENDGVYGIKVILEELGFTVKKVARDNPNASPAHFTAQMVPDRKNRAGYDHPIAEMGTRLASELSIIELFGSWEPASIVSEVRKTDSRRMPIVLLNGSLSLAQRRQLARLFLEQGNAQNPFILIDWVLLLHLASKVREERLRVLLMCAMPYTGAKQLFSKTSAVPIADEMYIGRTDEISQILDKNGPVIVYGGRQLGKTALLLRAKNRFHAPDQNDYGVYVDVKNSRNEKYFVETVGRELKDAGIGIRETNSVDELCNELRSWIKSGNKRLLLLIDESDNLLSELANDNYAALTPLETLCRSTESNFKFVFAGLHNVFLAANDANTIFGHFGKPLCIEPMSQADAYKLLARPLKYLGFNTDPDMLLRLLVNTNFYPGVVHSLGASLVEMLTNKYEEHYDDRKNPPYELTDRQISAIMNSADLAALIEDRIRMTLNVDPAYSTLVRSIALLYYLEEEKRSSGYSVETILEYADDSLRNAGKWKCVNLLSELCSMCILVETDGLYRFRQSRFLNIVGKSADDIMDQNSASKGTEDDQ